MRTNSPILLFDGHCNLCNSSVQFVLRHEKNATLQFTSLQSEIGTRLLQQYNINTKEIDSLILIEDDTIFVKSSAALRLTKHLKGLYPVLRVFLIIPAFIRNAVYDYVARNRYKWFGKTESCMVPSPEIKNRFLE